MAIEFTADQKNAIYGNGTLLVYAAAGSGKTAVLTKRVIERVCNVNDPTTIDRLLIVTFTNASALEMRTRIAKELDRKCAENPGNAYILKQKLLLKNAKICTIDSFCIDIVRKYFSVLGISPDFTVATSADTEFLSEKALKTVLAKHYFSPSADFKNLCDSFNIYNGEKSLNEAINDIYEACLCMSSPQKWLFDALENYNCTDIGNNAFANIIFDDAFEKLSTVKELFNMVIRETEGYEVSGKITAAFSEAIEYVDCMLKALKYKNWDGLYDLSCGYSTPSIPQQKQWSNADLLQNVKKIRDNCKDSIKAISSNMCGPESVFIEQLRMTGRQVKVLIDLVQEYSEEYFKLLNQYNILSFAHVEQLALKLLCDEKDGKTVPSKLSQEICKQYDEVLVDEYQDNNDLQDALFYAVSDSGKHLFLVGDVKQSIYGFRNASPDNFLNHKNNFLPFDGVTTPSKVILSENFRSRKGVCDFVNGICGALMQKKTSGINYDREEQLVASAEFPDNGVCDAEIILNNCVRGQKNETDAKAVADYIVKTMAEKPFLRDSDTGKLRPAQYGDFAVLLRSPGSKVGYYTDILKSYGIPVSYNVGEFFKSAEILTAISILRVIDNPTNEIALLSALTSAAFGFSLDDIADFKIRNKSLTLYANLINAANEGDKRCKAFFETVNYLSSRAVTLPIGKFINEMYRVTHLKEIMSAKENGYEIKQNLITLKAIADEYEKLSSGGLTGFIAHFDRLASDGKPMDKALKNGKNAVKIMSFHSSKGLQFPICIVAGLGNNFNKTDLNDKLIISKSAGIGMNIVCDKIKHETASRKAMRIVQSKKLISEELRLLYVAMTRAEERLVLSITSTDCRKDIESAAAGLGLSAESTGLVPNEAVLNSQSFKPMVLSAALLQKSGNNLGEIADISPIGFNGGGDFKLTFRENFASEEAVSSETEVLIKNSSSDPELIKLFNERFSFNYIFENDTVTPSKMAVTSLVHGDKSAFRFKSRPRFMSKSGLTPAERGTAMHKVMQYIDFTKAETDLQSELDRLYEYEFLSLEEYESLNLNALEEFFKSNLYKRINHSEKILREYKFMIKYPFNDTETIIQGIADCIFFENGKAIIVDFKTDNVSDMSILSERYGKQLEIYKTAVGEILSVKVSQCIIYSLHLSAETEV